MDGYSLNHTRMFPNALVQQLVRGLVTFMSGSHCTTTSRQIVAIHKTQLVVLCQEFYSHSVVHTTDWAPTDRSHTTGLLARRNPWYVKEARILLPQLHRVFFHDLGPGSACDFQHHIETLQHSKITFVHKYGMFIVYTTPTRVTPPPSFSSLCASGSHWPLLSGYLGSAGDTLVSLLSCVFDLFTHTPPVSTCECQATANLSLICGYGREAH